MGRHSTIVSIVIASLLATSVPAALAADGAAPVAHVDKHAAKKKKKRARKHRKPRSAAPAPVAPDDCSAADADPVANPAAGARATLCLLNIERTSRGLGRVEANAALATAAEGHARDMVSRGYFSHDGNGGLDLVGRILTTGYVGKSATYFLGENLAWGQGIKKTPRQAMIGWMNSPGHRANILNDSFVDVGVGIVGGAPVPNYPDSATYATEFGTR